MNLDTIISVQYCYSYLIDQIPVSLLLYSHIPTAILSLLFSGFVFYKEKSQASKMLLFTCVMFAIWCLSDLGSWFAFMGSSSTMFLWSILDLFSVLIFFFSYTFIVTFITNKKLPNLHFVILIVLGLPIALYTLLGAHLPLYDANSCEAVEAENYSLYLYFVEFLIIIATLVFSVRHYFKAQNNNERSQIILSSTGVLIFLIFFFTATLTVSLLAESENLQYVYNYEIYGLFGMPVLLVYLSYIIVRFKAFNIKFYGAQALILGLIALICSEFFFVESKINLILVSVTLILSLIGGFFLVKSVQKEITQKEKIEQLAIGLEKANERLQLLDKQKSEFVSIASHQLRSPLTAIRGYVSMMQEGSYGQMSEKADDVLNRVQESAKFMASSINDFLEVSRIESGNMKYDYSDINLREQAEHIVEDLRTDAIKRGLVLMFKSDMHSKGYVHADGGKTQQILHNVINNAMKYTPKGTVTVLARDDVSGKKMVIDVIDTGLGMSHETMEKLFAKFSRAKVASSANIMGTGLGLFVARSMCRAMGGDISCSSDGEGKGSTFTIMMPLLY